MAHFKGWAVSLVLAVCCAVCHGDFEQWHWSSGPNLPRLRAHTACVATEDTVYFFGGAGHLGVHPHASKFHTQHNPWLKDVIRFDSATQGYANVTHMEAPRLGMSATYHQGTIYLVGGKGLLMGAVIAYDIQRDSFSAMESMPKGRMFHATVCTPRSLYPPAPHPIHNCPKPSAVGLIRLQSFAATPPPLSPRHLPQDGAWERAGQRLLCAPIGEVTPQVDILGPNNRRWGGIPRVLLNNSASPWGGGTPPPPSRTQIS